ncbi:hypothetical protein LCGC14_3115570, partial [marine sediment metagenome]
MAKQVYVFYKKTNPFSGCIETHGIVDLNQPPDGSTFAEHLEKLKVKYSDSDYFLFPLGTEVDPETQKFDTGTSTLIALDPGDITPNEQEILDESQKAQDIADNLPSWDQVETNINNISDMDSAKAFILKLARVVYWDVK